jgi:putative ABC transport system substrate-binding protein
VWRIAVLQVLAEKDPETIERHAAFEKALAELGWSKGRVQIDYRWAEGDVERVRKYAKELVGLTPDVILASGSIPVSRLLEETRIIPIVFAQVVDPVGAGFVDSMARPAGNVTGFTQFDYSLSGKWLELLKEIAPHVTRAAVIRDPTRGPGIGQFAVLQVAAASLGVELRPINALDTINMDSSVANFAGSPNGGLIVTPGGTGFNRNLIVPVAARHRLPAVYPFRYYVMDGGLVSYGPNTVHQFQRAAGYVDRILKGEKPADLPVQAPTKYELVLNLKTAKTLDLTIPPQLLARADEVIE